MYPYRPLTQESWWLSEGADLIESSKMISHISLNDEKVVGHAALVLHGSYWECGRWAVDPSVQGRMVGHSLVQACVDFAKLDGIAWFVTGCSYYQSLSERICRSLGMKFLGINPNIYRIKGTSWGETLFIWHNPGKRAPVSFTKRHVRQGIAGLWPKETGGWKQIVATDNLLRFVIEQPVGVLKGSIPVHTTHDTLMFMRM
jgi:RimJ/RimL family protein N-acetyltransferase